MRDRLDGLRHDEDFAGWYPGDGRPGLSPAQLAAVCVPQFPRYAVRSGAEGTINAFVHGHGMRRCRSRGQPKAHLRHVFTALAVNIERLSGLMPAQEPSSPRPLTAFQTFLDQLGILRVVRSKAWRILGS